MSHSTAPITITRHEVPDATTADLGPYMSRMDNILSAKCGDVTGDLVRYVDEEGVLYQVRLDGSHETGGFSRWCSDTADNLHQLIQVATVLQGELEVIQ